MGCGASIKQERYHLNEEQCNKLKSMMHQFGLKVATVDKFYKIFHLIDNDSSGFIDTGEFCAYIDIEHTKFIARVFTVMDEDSSGKLDFWEFVAAVYNYCSYDWKALVKYAFMLFDHDGSGILEVSEVEQLVGYVYGSKIDSKVQQILRGIDKDKSGTVSFVEFCEYNRNFPILLFPAFHVQECIRRKVLGVRYWEKFTSKRQQADPDARPILDQLMEMQKQFESKGRLDMDEETEEASGRPGHEHDSEPASAPGGRPARDESSSGSSREKLVGKIKVKPAPNAQDLTGEDALEADGGSTGSDGHRHHSHPRHNGKHKKKKQKAPNASRAMALSKEYSEGGHSRRMC